jgi:hypothetical protein
MIAATMATSFGAEIVFISVDFRLGRGRNAFEEIEVATLIRLRNVLLVERAEAALVTRRRRFRRRDDAPARRRSP